MFLKLLVPLLFTAFAKAGILYPQESETRELKSLDGIWDFRLDPSDCAANFELCEGYKFKWHKKPLAESGRTEMMPVPSSFNDVGVDPSVRDHIGWVWYGRSFRVPERWERVRIFLRFGSANYFAVVWVNGVPVMNHTGGHLPFQCDVTRVVKVGEVNYVTVALDNTLSAVTIPQGTLHRPNDTSKYPPGFKSQAYNFDYFHYAGIHRPVYIYTTPKVYIDDITVTTEVHSRSLASLHFDIKHRSCLEGNSIYSNASFKCEVLVRNANGSKVAFQKGCSGSIKLENPRLWWPYLFAPKKEQPGYQHTLEVRMTSEVHMPLEDVYRLKFGIRSVFVNNSGFFVNGKKFYFHGFGRHEDYSVRGRGVDPVMLVKDHNLIQWIGANSYRTSHYPYAEEILDLTDRLGIVVIDESPAIGLSGYEDTLLGNHKQVMKELVQRDKNRASVVMWSLGNEPKSMQNASTAYFEKVLKYTRSCDPAGRPMTIVLNEGFAGDKGPRGLDVVSINRYFAWYGDTGRPEVIRLQIPTEVRSWFDRYQKPVLIAEYGAGSIAGFHTQPAFVWTEDFQTQYLIEHFKAFDSLRVSNSTSYFIGEMIWNFADFATPPETFRPWGCMKGVFTRDRLPKAAAHAVRYRYWKLANETVWA